MKKTNNSRFGSPSEWQNELGGSKLYKHKIYFTDWGDDVYFEIISKQKEAFDDFNEAINRRLKTTFVYLNDDGEENYFISARIYKDGEGYYYAFEGFGMNYEGSVFDTDNPFGFGAPIRDPAITDEVEEL